MLIRGNHFVVVFKGKTYIYINIYQYYIKLEIKKHYEYKQKGEEYNIHT